MQLLSCHFPLSFQMFEIESWQPGWPGRRSPTLRFCFSPLALRPAVSSGLPSQFSSCAVSRVKLTDGFLLCCTKQKLGYPSLRHPFILMPSITRGGYRNGYISLLPFQNLKKYCTKTSLRFCAILNRGLSKHAPAGEAYPVGANGFHQIFVLSRPETREGQLLPQSGLLTII